MEVAGGAEEGFIREWTPCSHILNLIPPRIQTGIFSSELCLTCVDAVSEYIALGTNVGLVYWYDRKKGNIQRLRCEAANSPITFVKIVSTVDYMVGAGNAAGQVTVFQIPKEHPDNIPDNFKPKVEPKVERYTIGDLHKSKITAIEWSKNGMRLFSGDKNGVIIMTEIDFYMHLCKSMEIVNEQHEIVQMSYYQNSLLVSSVYRCIMCSLRDGRWRVNQIGRRERKTLCAVGAVWQYSYARGGAPQAYCARPGLRLWRADAEGQVLQTLLFKDAITNPLTVAELLNPSATRHSPTTKEFTLGPLHVFRDQFLVAHDDRVLLLLEPASQQCVAATDQLRRILSVSVNRDEIFVLEGPRSLVRLAHTPEPAASAALSADDSLNLMSKSLTTLQNAVNTTTSLLDQTVPYISSVLEQPISMFTKNELIESQPAIPGEECFELPPIKHLPVNLSENVLQSIINEFQDVSTDAEETRRAKSEELQSKLNLYKSYLNRNEELIHSSRRSRRKEGGSGGNTPRRATPVRKEGGTTTTAPCVMQASVYSDTTQPNDELLEQQIEEKERILAKMLNLASLTMAAPPDIADTYPDNDNHNDDSTYPHNGINNTPNAINNTTNGINNTPNGINNTPNCVNNTPTSINNTPNGINNTPNSQNGPNKHLPDRNTNTFEQGLRTNGKEAKYNVDANTNKPVNAVNGDLVPKVMKLPNNWNLDLELKLDIKGYKDRLMSPDDHLDSEWEII